MHASTPYNDLYFKPVSARDFCQPVGGLNARDQRSGEWQQGIKRHERLSAKAPVRINVKSSIALCSGLVDGADPRASGKRKRSKAMRTVKHDGMPGGWQEAITSL